MGSNPYIGDIMPFAGNFAPKGWAFCNGQLMSIAQNSALFSILGTMYGGDGMTTFGLPDLRGRLPVGMGQGPGLSNYVQGEASGSETVTLLQTQIPAHNHAVAANNGTPTSTDPSGSVFSSGLDSKGDPAPSFLSAPSGAMNGGAVQPSGGTQAHENLSPFLSINFCIATEGMYPSRS